MCNPTVDPGTNKLVGYTFDNAGNTKTDAENRTFIYDAENKQTEVKDSSGNKVGQYFYDGDGKRVKKIEFSGNTPVQTTIFVYDSSGRMVAEYATEINTVDPQVSYLTNDHLGSPRITTDKDGKVFSRRDFMPFGEEIKSDITLQRSIGHNYGEDGLRQKFTSYERDTETDLDFAQARMYSSKLGRYNSVDPYNIILEVKIEKDNDKARDKLNTYLLKPQQWNRYIYVANNPLKYVDPSGEILELTGTRAERDRTLKRLQELVGEDAQGRLYIEEKDGRTFVGYLYKKGDLAKKIGDIGQVLEDIIDSTTTVEILVTDKNVVTTANGNTENLTDRGGGVTAFNSKDKIQIFIKDNAAAIAQSKAAQAGATGTDGKPLTFVTSLAVAHELGHAWGGIKDNYVERYNKLSWYQSASHLYKEQGDRSVQVENWQRARLGMALRRSH